MSPRDQVKKLVAGLREDASKHYELGIKLLDRASLELASGQKLEQVAAKLTDAQLEEAIRDVRKS